MWRSLLALVLLLAGCGDLPQPFRGRPGAEALLLSRPPAPRLAVTPPTAALLPDSAADTWAGAVADALTSADYPAVSSLGARPGDWRLVLSAELQGGAVVPTYTVVDPRGKEQGASVGPRVPAEIWASGDPAALKQAAAAAEPGISAMLGRIEAARRQSDPNSLVNRPGRIYLAGITGAPGDGNAALASQIRIKLASRGLVVQDTPANADYKLEGKVDTEPGVNGTVRVEVQWIVTDPAGTERGRVLQLNEVPPATIARFWGDVAVVVAEEAAGGIRDVVLTQAGIRKPPRPAGAPAA